MHSLNEAFKKEVLDPVETFGGMFNRKDMYEAARWMAEKCAEAADCTIVQCKPNTAIKVANIRAIWIRETIRQLSKELSQ